jgi:xanthine dehydrogenase accessory factor
MIELLDDLDRWHTAGLDVVVARVVDIDGSGPRLPGAAMAVSADGEVAGSVSGGCVEGAVVAEALELLATGEGPRAVSFGYSDDEAFAVGLTCGGTVHLFLDVVPRDGHARVVFDALTDALRARRPVAWVTMIDGPHLGASLLVEPDDRATGRPQVQGSLGDADLDRVVARDALGELEAGATLVRHYGERGEAREGTVSVFVESFAPPARLFVFGAVDFTKALVRVAKVLGFHVTVCDAREVFATRRRFPQADDVVVDWPHRLIERVQQEGPPLGPRDAVCVLTHDHKFDVPAIIAALGTDVGYLGAMGSRRTHAERLERLQHEGIGPAAVERVMAPIGLDIGGRTPEETAVAICAEMIAVRTGRSAPSLRDSNGPIHA